MTEGIDSPRELPKGWMWANLEDITDVILGQSPPSSTYNTEGIGLPFFQGKAEFGEIYPTPEKWCSSPQKLAEKGDILISVRAPVGPTNICPEKSCIGRGLAAIRPMGDIGSFFLLHSLRTFENEIAGKGTGTTFQAITGDKLKRQLLPLPPLPEQRRIVAKIEELLTKLDAGVEALKKVKAELKHYRQSVLKSAFEGKLTAEWRMTNKGKIESGHILLQRLKEEKDKGGNKKYKSLSPVDISDLLNYPKEWALASTSEICASVRDGTHDTPKYTEEGIPLITSKNLSEYGLDFSTAKNISIEDHKNISIRSEVEQGDILFAMIGTIGNPVVVRTERQFSIKNVALFKKNEAFLSSEYLRYWLSSFVLTKILDTKDLLKGTTQRFIPLENLRVIPVPIAPFEEQKKIVEEIDRHFSVTDGIEKVVQLGLQQANRLRQSILKKAFEGNLVEQDPTDEPAEKLLERIKAEKEKQTSEGKARTKPKKQKNSNQGRLI